MQRLIFDSSPFLILLCAAAGVGYAWLLYSSKYSWGRNINRLLFAFRFAIVFFLCFLLIGPILKLTTNVTERPTIAVLTDNSVSLKEAIPEERRNVIKSEIEKLKNQLEESGYSVVVKNLNNEDVTEVNWNNSKSDLNSALRSLLGDFESKNLSGIVLLSDGIYNSGSSPLYLQTRVPIYAVGTGDTTQRTDVALKNVAYNKIAYQGNRFTMRAEVMAQGMPDQNITVSVSKNGKALTSQTKNSGASSFFEFDFVLEATEQGTQRFDISIEPLSGEYNKRNNYASAFIEVVEGRKRIVLAAPSPHPDIKALRSVIEKNSNYELILHIPGISTTDPATLQPDKAALAIFYDVVDYEGKTKTLLDQFVKSGASLLFIVGNKSNLRQLNINGVPFVFETPGQWDNVTPVINNAFQNFSFLENASGVFARYPPAEVPFGKFTYPAQAKILLYQRIGSVATERPLILTWEDGSKKVATLLGHDFWRWRLYEFADRENTEYFDDVFSKLIQYLSTIEDKRKFRSFPIQNEFAEGEAVVIESQVYNDLFELVYGNTISLQVRGEKGNETLYSYITSPGNMRYRIGGLKEGVYRMKASTELNGKKEEVSSQFIVKAQNIESQNLTADHGLLRKIAINSGGRFYRDTEWGVLSNDLTTKQATSIIHSEDTFNPLINLKLVFFLLLTLVGAEWFLRKFMGAY